MAFHKWINNLTAGEWSPFLDGRTDLDKYDFACRTLENVRPMPYGGGRMRGGLEYIAEVADSDKPHRVIGFKFSTGTRFVLEFGDNTLRFYSNGVQVESSPGVPYTLVTPYSDETVFILQVKQINDVVYLTHPVIAPYKLSRVTDTNWTLTEVNWTYPPLREENTTDITLACSNRAIGTGRTLTAVGGTPFTADNIGGYFEIRHLREGDGVDLAISGSAGNVTSTSLTVRGDWQVVTTERWYGVLLVQRSTDAGSTWKTIRKFKSSANRNVSATGTETEECLLRLDYTATGDPYGAGTWVGVAPTAYVRATATLESTEAYTAGLIKVTGFTSSTSLTVDVIQTLGATTATDLWSEGAWSTRRGFPATVGLFEQRLLFGATSEKPTRWWGSVTGDFENFTYGDDDDAAVAFDIATAESNPIKWIQSLGRVLMGTSGTEHSAAAGDANEPLTPSNVAVRDHSAYGSGDFQPITVGDAVLYIQRQGRKLREMSFDIQKDGYVSPDLTLLAEHVTSPSILQLAFAQQPDPTVFASTGEHLAVLTYNREQSITAWSRYTSEDGDAFFESVTTIYGDEADEVWCVVRRTVDNDQKRYVERFAVESESKTASRLLDSYVDGTLVAPFSGTISGLDHLEAKTVRLVVAGAVIGDYVVTGGAITVNADDVPTLGTYVVGLPYNAIIQPMKIEVPMANGASAGRQRRISELTLRFKDTAGGVWFGPDLDNLEEVILRDADDPQDSSFPVFTGDVAVSFAGIHDKGGDLFIVQKTPLPFTLLGISVKAEIAAS